MVLSRRIELDLQIKRDLRSCALKNIFEKGKLGQFWTKIKNKKNIFGMHTVKAFLPFVPTCLCESGFSALSQIKTRTRNCLEHKIDILKKLWNQFKAKAHIDQICTFCDKLGSAKFDFLFAK